MSVVLRDEWEGRRDRRGDGGRGRERERGGGACKLDSRKRLTFRVIVWFLETTRAPTVAFKGTQVARLLPGHLGSGGSCSPVQVSRGRMSPTPPARAYALARPEGSRLFVIREAIKRGTLLT